jgi:hypothetical protein
MSRLWAGPVHGDAALRQLLGSVDKSYQSSGMKLAFRWYGLNLSTALTSDFKFVLLATQPGTVQSAGQMVLVKRGPKRG